MPLGESDRSILVRWFKSSRRTLCDDFQPAGLAVVAPVENSVYKTELQTASHNWSKPVLILLNVRLGISGVTPVYFPGIKGLFTFPQTVGIAGGRPSSSYYFVGSQGDSLFYIDPHYPKLAVPVRWPSDSALIQAALTEPLSLTTDLEEWESLAPAEESKEKTTNGLHNTPSLSDVSSLSMSLPKTPSHLDQFFTSVYSPLELATYHPERVRKMPLTGLDPSMLIGFLIR